MPTLFENNENPFEHTWPFATLVRYEAQTGDVSTECIRAVQLRASSPRFLTVADDVSCQSELPDQPPVLGLRQAVRRAGKTFEPGAINDRYLPTRGPNEPSALQDVERVGHA